MGFGQGGFEGVWEKAAGVNSPSSLAASKSSMTASPYAGKRFLAEAEVYRHLGSSMGDLLHGICKSKQTRKSNSDEAMKQFLQFVQSRA